jgi:peptide chain release factor 1
LKSAPVKVATMRSRWSSNKCPFTRRRASGVVFDLEIVDQWNGLIILRIVGNQAWELFRRESGGHRWQRVPPNERKAKVHSSTVTVAVFPDAPRAGFSIRESDCEITTCRGSGPGGQKRNKTESAVQVKHKPSGMFVRCDTERSQGQNKATAMALLAARLEARHDAGQQQAERNDRRNQIGSGERSDKIRTVQMQNGQVVNHTTGRKAPVEKYLKGDIWCVA